MQPDMLPTHVSGVAETGALPGGAPAGGQPFDALPLTRTVSADFPAHLKGAVIAIGNFDGVHLGHRELIRQAALLAEAAGAPLGVLTFEPHPRSLFISHEPHRRISSVPRKCQLLSEAGIDFTVVEPFTADLAACEPETFVREYLVRRLGVGHILVGEDYRFGRGRVGDIVLLRTLGRELGFAVTALEKLGTDGVDISSTLIRDLLRRGEVQTAVNLLGTDWVVTGTVLPAKCGNSQGLEIRLDEADYIRLPPGGYEVIVKSHMDTFRATALVTEHEDDVLRIVTNPATSVTPLPQGTRAEIAFPLTSEPPHSQRSILRH